MVEVEQGPLRALEQDALARSAESTSSDVSATNGAAAARTPRAGSDLLELERLQLVDPLEPDVLSWSAVSIFWRRIFGSSTSWTGSRAARPCRRRRADPASRRPDLELPSRFSPAPSIAMCQGMIRCALPETERLRRDPSLLEPVDLVQQHLGVDHAAGAEHAQLAREDPRREVAELERLAVHDHRVAGVRAALVAADDVARLREQVDDLCLRRPTGRRRLRSRAPWIMPVKGMRAPTGAPRSAEDADRMAPRCSSSPCARARARAVPPRASEIAVLGRALLADDGVRRRPSCQPDRLIDHARAFLRCPECPVVVGRRQPHLLAEPPQPARDRLADSVVELAERQFVVTIVSERDDSRSLTRL